MHTTAAIDDSATVSAIETTTTTTTSNTMVHNHPSRREDWVDRTMKLAQTCNKLFTRNTCRVCQVYVDKQVEFEKGQENDHDDVSPLSRVWLKTSAAAPTIEVELYRQFLFDEDSVVETVCEREDKENEPNKMTTAAIEVEMSKPTQQ